MENPFRFTVPVSFKNQKAAQEQEKSAENNNSRNSKRPELKIFSSQETNSQLQKERKDISKYQDFIDRELAQKISLIAQIDIDNINEKVEAKMSCLKSVLSAERFKEAHNSCVREELIKKLNIIDYKTWLSNKQ